MKDFLRPYRGIGIALLVGAGLVIAPSSARAQAMRVAQVVDEPGPLLLHASSSQGYLGVDLADVDQEKAQALKLKEVRGAVITLIDHDAPAGQKGLKVNDVVLKLNGQTVEGAEQLRRMLREIPAKRKVSLEVSRDGNLQTVELELVDRRVMERDIWKQLGSGSDVFTDAPGMSILAAGNESLPNGFHMPFFGSSLNVGAMVEPLTSQMAEYLGVPSGLMVKQVAHKSEAETAGLKAFDVILKVGSEAIANLSGWDRALRLNQGKPVQVTILRDRKLQTLTLQVDSKHKGSIEFEEIFPSGDGPVVAEIGPDFAQGFVWDDEAAKDLRDKAEALKEQLKAGEFQIDPKQVEELKRQMQEFRKNFKAEDFQIGPKRMEELKQQMEKLRQSLKPEDFKLDPKLKLHRFRLLEEPPSFEDRQREEMNQLRRQMEERKSLGFGDHV